MLCLTRKTNQSIVLILPDGTKLTVSVNKIHAQAVSLGIDAPKDVKVWREELFPEYPLPPN